METNVQKNQDDLIRYLPNGAQIRLDNILTINKLVYINELLIKKGNSHIDVIQILGVRDHGGMVYLKIKDQKTGHIGEISSVLDRENKLFVWWVVSYEYVMNALEDRLIDRIKGTENLEFEF